RVIPGALMLADQDSVRSLDRPAPGRYVAAEEGAHVALADEADAGGILLCVARQASLARQPAHVGFGELADRKYRSSQLFLAQAMQEVALVLVRVDAAQQLPFAVLAAVARVVSGGDAFRAEFAGVIEKDPELDLAIAQHVGIRCATGAIFGDEMGKYLLAVFAGEVACVERNAEARAQVERILAVLIGLARASRRVVFPVLHEHAGQRLPALGEQQRT